MTGPANQQRIARLPSGPGAAGDSDRKSLVFRSNPLSDSNFEQASGVRAGFGRGLRAAATPCTVTTSE